MKRHIFARYTLEVNPRVFVTVGDQASRSSTSGWTKEADIHQVIIILGCRRLDRHMSTSSHGHSEILRKKRIYSRLTDEARFLKRLHR